MAWRLFLVSGSLWLAWSLWPTWSAPTESESGEFHARRIWLDPDRPWFPWMQQGDWITVPRKEFEETLQKANLQSQADRHPPRLMAAYYSARWEEEGLQGQAAWTIHQENPVMTAYRTDGWNLALNDRPRWGNQAALAGQQAGQLEVYCQHQGQRELTFRWSRIAERRPQGARVTLKIPSAPLVVVDVDVPRQYRLSWPEAPHNVSFLGDAPGAADHHRWRLTRGEGDAQELVLLIQPVQASTALPTAPPLQRMEYRIDPQETTFRCDFIWPKELAAPRQLTFRLDPALAIRRVLDSSEATPIPMAWHISASPDGTRRLTIPLTERPLEKLRIEGRVERSPANAGLWTQLLAQLHAESVRGVQEKTSFFIHRGLELIAADWGQFQPRHLGSIETPEAIDSDGWELVPRHWRIQNREQPRLTIRSSPSNTIVTQNTWCLLHSTQSRCVAHVQWQQVLGARSVFEVQVPAGWIIEQVAAEPAQRSIQWLWNPSAPDQPLQILPRSAVKPQEALNAWIVLRAAAPLFEPGSASRVNLPNLAPLDIQGYRGRYHVAVEQARRAQGWAPLFKTSLDLDSGVRLLDQATTLPEKVEEWLGREVPPWVGSMAQFHSPSAGMLLLEPLQPQLASQVKARVRGQSLTFHLMLEPEQGSIRTIRCQFSAPMPGLTWKTVRGTTQLTSWQRIDERHALLQLDRPLSEPLHLLATGEWNPHGELSLLWIPQIGDGQASFQVEQLPGQRLTPFGHGLLPSRQDESAEPVYPYNGSTRGIRLTNQPLPSSVQADPVALLDPQFTAWIEPQGGLRWEYRVVMRASAEGFLELTVPSGSTLSHAERNGQVLSLESGPRSQVALPKSRGTHVFVLRGGQPLPHFTWWGRMELAWPAWPSVPEAPPPSVRVILPRGWQPLSKSWRPWPALPERTPPSHASANRQNAEVMSDIVKRAEQTWVEQVVDEATMVTWLEQLQNDVVQGQGALWLDQAAWRQPEHEWRPELRLEKAGFALLALTDGVLFTTQRQRDLWQWTNLGSVSSSDVIALAAAEDAAKRQHPPLGSRWLKVTRELPLAQTLSGLSGQNWEIDPSVYAIWMAEEASTTALRISFGNGVLPHLLGASLGAIVVLGCWRHPWLALLLALACCGMLGWSLYLEGLLPRFWLPCFLWIIGSALSMALGRLLRRGSIRQMVPKSNLVPVGLMVIVMAGSLHAGLGAQAPEPPKSRAITVFILPAKSGKASDEHVVVTAKDWQDLQAASRTREDKLPDYLILSVQSSVAFENDHAQLQAQWLIHSFKQETALQLPWGAARLQQLLVNNQPAVMKPTPKGLAVTLNKPGEHRVSLDMEAPLSVQADQVQLELLWPGAALTSCRVHWPMAMHERQTLGSLGIWRHDDSQGQTLFHLGGTEQTQWSWLRSPAAPPNLKAQLLHELLPADKLVRLNSRMRFEVASGAVQEVSLLIPDHGNIESIQWIGLANDGQPAGLVSWTISAPTPAGRILQLKLNRRYQGPFLVSLVSRWEPQPFWLQMISDLLAEHQPWTGLVPRLHRLAEGNRFEDFQLNLPKPLQTDIRGGYLLLPETAERWQLLSSALALPPLAHRALWRNWDEDPLRKSFHGYFLSAAQMQQPLRLRVETPAQTATVEATIQLTLRESASEFNALFRIEFPKAPPLQSDVLLPEGVILSDVRSPALLRWHQVGQRCVCYWKANPGAKTDLQMQGWWQPNVHEQTLIWTAPAWQWLDAKSLGGRIELQLPRGVQAVEVGAKSGVAEVPVFFGSPLANVRTYLMQSPAYQLRWRIEPIRP